MPIGDDEKFEDVEEEEDLSSCETWNDGCNDCTVENGQIMDCTSKFCKAKKLTKPRCSKKIKFESPLDGCTKWFNGCHNCDVKNGRIDPECKKDGCDSRE